MRGIAEEEPQIVQELRILSEAYLPEVETIKKIIYAELLSKLFDAAEMYNISVEESTLCLDRYTYVSYDPTNLKAIINVIGSPRMVVYRDAFPDNDTMRLLVPCLTESTVDRIVVLEEKFMHHYIDIIQRCCCFTKDLLNFFNFNIPISDLNLQLGCNKAIRVETGNIVNCGLFERIVQLKIIQLDKIVARDVVDCVINPQYIEYVVREYSSTRGI